MCVPPRSSRPESGRGWWLSGHARQRAAQRGISPAEITEALCHPAVTYTQNSYGPGRQVRQHGSIAVVVNPDNQTVITVLFRDPARWRTQLTDGGQR